MRTGRRRTSALSLKSLTEKVEAVELTPEEEIDRNTLPKTAFSEGKLLHLWSEYAQQLIKKGDKSLASILLASKPTLSEFHVHYSLPNQMMAEQLERLRPRLLKYLRDSLNNFSIDLTIKVEVTEVKKFVYKPNNRFIKKFVQS
jgi:DNA polymerase III subunit gamma/tau